MRSASGALMNALRNDVDLHAFGEMVESVKTHAAEFGTKTTVSPLLQCPAS